MRASTRIQHAAEVGRVDETPPRGQYRHAAVTEGPDPNNDAYAPFGGTGSSGNGSRFGSQSSWDEFTRWQWVTARPQAHGFPF